MERGFPFLSFFIQFNMATLKRHLRNAMDLITGKEPWTYVQIRKKMQWLGNPGAGFFVCSEMLRPQSIVYSFGLGEDISFDKGLIEKYGCQVFGFDPTPKSIAFMEKNKIDGFHFFPVGLSDSDGTLTFYLPQNPGHVSCTTYNRWGYDETVIKPIDVPVKKFSTLVAELGHSRIDILKIDIEGSEYGVIDDIIKSDVEIGQIMLEFHHRFNGISPKMTLEVVRKLKNAGFKIAAISETREEYTFIK